MEDLIILQKAFEMMEYGYTALAQYPKSEKFALVVDIKRCMHKILEKIIEANKKYYKKTTLQELDVEIMKLKAYLRLSYNLKFLPSKKYEIWSSKSVELGRMVGGWIKSTKKRLVCFGNRIQRLPLCGGRWNNGANAGVFNVNLNNPRSISNSNVGFRSALLSYARGGKFKDLPTVREDKGVYFHSGLKGRRKMVLFESG